MFLMSVRTRIETIQSEDHISLLFLGESTNDRFVGGVVLLINGIKYYAPISHKWNKKREVS